MAKGKTLEAIISIAGQVEPSLKKSLKDACANVDSFQDKAKVVGKTIEKAVVTGATAATTAVVAFTGAAVSNAAEMQKEMSNVATLLDGTSAQVAQRVSELQKDVLSVSNVAGIDTSDLTDGLYQVISAVGDTEDSIGNLEIAAKAAKAGNATTTDSINLLTAVTKGYGDTSRESFEKVSDLAFQTVKLGQTSFPELASSIGQVTGLASTLSLSEEELFGAAATLTGVTGGTAEVMTQMKNVLSGMMSPSKNMAAALKSIGYSSGSAAIESLGLQGTLEALSTTVDGDTEKLAKLFGSVNAQTAVLALAGSQAQNFADKTQAMYDAAGATSRAFDAQTDNIDYVIASIKNLGKNFLTEIGLVALPQVQALAEEALPLITDGLEEIGPYVSDMVSGFTTETLPLITDLLPSVADGLDKILPCISEISSTGIPLITEIITEASPIVEEVLPLATDGLTTVFGLIGDNIGVIEALVAGTTAAVGAYKLYNGAMTLYNTLSPIYTALTASKTAAATAATAATTAATAAITAEATATTAATGPTAAFGIAINAASLPVLAVVAAIGLLIAAVVLVVKNFDKVKIVAGALKFALCAVATSIKNFFVTAFTGVVAAVKVPFNTVISCVNKVVDKINALKIDIPSWVPALGGKSFQISIPSLPMLADGGFTTGLSIAGEDGEEAVISFKKTVRSENIGYWLDAGERLGINFDNIYDTFTSGYSGSQGETNYYYELGGVSFNPTVIIKGSASKADVDNSIREQREEFFDRLDEWWDDKTGGGGTFDPRY